MRWLVLIAVTASLGAEVRTANFQVAAANADAAELVGRWAEHHRRQGALKWFGKDMPAWVDPCPLSVEVTFEPPRGSTKFRFAYGRVGTMHMAMSGPLDQLLSNVLPHEITHTLLAHHFGRELPRWADEGAAILAEQAQERNRRIGLARQLCRQNRLVRLRILLPMTEYPDNQDQLAPLYCQGVALVDYLLTLRDRQTFLRFLAEAFRTNDWDQAVRDVYGFQGVDDLEERWLLALMGNGE